MTPARLKSLIDEYFHNAEWGANNGKLLRRIIITAINETKEDAAVTCEANHIISGGPGPLFNAGWSEANKADASAIRASKIRSDV